MSFTFIGSTTSSGATIAAHASAANGDLGILIQEAQNNSGVPTAVTPGTFSNVVNTSNGSDPIRCLIDIGPITGSGQVLTGMDGTSADLKILLIFRPNGVMTGLTGSSPNGQMTASAPTTQNIAVTGSPPEGIYIGAAFGVTAAPTPSGTLASTGTIVNGSSTNLKAVYLVNNSSPTATLTWGQNDTGPLNCLQSCFVTATITNATTGTLAATEGADAAALVGSLSVLGTIAATEGADSAGIVGRTGWRGTFAASEGSDVAAALGRVAWTGTLAATEGSDTAFFLSTNDVLGALAATEDADAASFAGSVVVAGGLAATEASDVASLSGGVPTATGALAATEAGDVVAMAGRIVVTGALAATEGADIAAFSGRMVVSGLLSATEGADVAAAVGRVGIITGTLAVSEAGDVAAFTDIPPALAFRHAVAAQHSRVPLPWLVTIDHPSLPNIIRWVNNPVPVVSRGQTFIARAFKVQRPADGDETPSLVVTLSNHDRVLGKALEALEGFPGLKLERILLSFPDDPVETYEDFTSASSRWDASAVEVTLSQEVFWNETYPLVRVTPRKFPGLFLS
ncbi:hypothetical protein G3545_14070 [Starkeya sp. ORNL1]|uniref:hypothetical protein n=1 Tax=Starkeya sp. ORNL1 TaxID=2709380 RepID=UPI0014638EDD|nr:hypothetical protein [Starkeya sp. ORNL1]QJP14670.1 hypothetical protein G3545_14070 [Starkeya sp. ORNL1]